MIVKPTFQREAKRMAKHYASFKEDLASLVDELEHLNLLCIYDKADQASISLKEIEQLLIQNELK